MNRSINASRLRTLPPSGGLYRQPKRAEASRFGTTNNFGLEIHSLRIGIRYKIRKILKVKQEAILPGPLPNHYKGT